MTSLVELTAAAIYVGSPLVMRGNVSLRISANGDGLAPLVRPNIDHSIDLPDLGNNAVDIRAVGEVDLRLSRMGRRLNSIDAVHRLDLRTDREHLGFPGVGRDRHGQVFVEGGGSGNVMTVGSILESDPASSSG
jgi:hypothetical protein